MIVIYHNPESPTSKECLKILETSKINHKVIEYQDLTLDAKKLTEIISYLQIHPIQLVRKESSVWKNNFQHLLDDGHTFTDDEIIQIMIAYPSTIVRPIVIDGKKAVVGRPPEAIKKIIL